MYKLSMFNYFRLKKINKCENCRHRITDKNCDYLSQLKICIAGCSRHNTQPSDPGDLSILAPVFE